MLASFSFFLYNGQRMNVHFVGIGGIGVSALARYYLAKGHRVSGCDLARSEITDQLKKLGVKIRIGKPDLACVKNAELVIYSPAVPKNHLELAGAQKARVLSYPEALGELTKTHYTIAVSGTHGKSTTTAMIGILLAKAGLDPTVIVGTKLKEFGDTNCRVGNSKHLVIEADEHFASFLHYRPRMIVLTTIEEDHLDYYKNLKNIIKTFRTYIGHLPEDGYLVYNAEDENTKQIVKHKTQSTEHKQNTKYPPTGDLLKGDKAQTRSYSIKQKEAEALRKILKVPGEHNVANALAALTVARILGVPDEISFKALSSYKGAWRRFETFQLKRPVSYTLISDYGHHPTEIKVTVEAARQKWPNKKLWLVYQPHQYQRTHYLFDDFVKTFSRLPIDKLILADIYDVAGREETAIRDKVSSLKLANAARNIVRSGSGPREILHISSLKEIQSYLQKNLKGGEIVLVMGAGDIYGLTVALTMENERKTIKA